MLVNYNSNFDQSQPWANGIRSIGNIMATMPAIRANAAARMAEANSRNAEARYRDAATDLTGEKTIGEHLKNQMTQGDIDGSKSAVEGVGQIIDDISNKRPISPEGAKKFFEGGARGIEKNPNQVTEALGKFIALISNSQGSTNYPAMAVDQGQAASIANNQADNAMRAARPLNVTGAEMTPEGKILGVAPRTIPIGSALTSGAEGTNAPTIVATNNKPAPAASPALPPSVQAEVFKSLLAHEGGGTNTVTALTGLQKAMGGQAAVGTKTMTPQVATQYLQKFGNRAKAEAAAKQDGYQW